VAIATLPSLIACSSIANGSTVALAYGRELWPCGHR
jgi:hypothetical protein